jgi:hypothetical protein
VSVTEAEKKVCDGMLNKFVAGSTPYVSQPNSLKKSNCVPSFDAMSKIFPFFLI